MSVVISRDLDSSITTREVAAVQEWLQSKKSFHIMRDHPQHCVPILGGTWGARMTEDTIRQEWVRTFQNMLEDPLNKASADKVGPDQALLQKLVWPWTKLQAMEHDSYW